MPLLYQLSFQLFLTVPFHLGKVFNTLGTAMKPVVFLVENVAVCLSTLSTELDIFIPASSHFYELVFASIIWRAPYLLYVMLIFYLRSS